MATIRTVFQHSTQPTWLENIAYRPLTNTILATNLLSPTLTHVDPSTSPPSSSTILTIPSLKSLTGICHVKDDVFAISAGDFSLETGPVAETWSLFLADFSVSPPKLEEVVKTKVGFINGIAKWDENTILVTDCTVSGASTGKIGKVDLAKGTFEVAIEDETMHLPPDAPFPTSINGIKVFRSKAGDSWIYWTNTTRKALYRIPVSADLKGLGPVEKVADGFMPDDFVLAGDGTAFVTVADKHTVLRVDKVGSQGVVVAGREDSMDLGGITALAFGKTENILYASTSGALAAPLNGTETEPAKVAEIVLP